MEDNEINQQVGRELLESVGIVVDLAENGQIALDKIATQHYDLVLMDMHMPVMDGITSTLRIRQNHDTTQLPILALTANTIQSELNRCIQAGMNDTITKPIEPVDLYSKLLRWSPKHEYTVQASIHPLASPSKPVDNVTNTEPNNQQSEIALPEIDGLDTHTGLMRLMGKRELYRNILQRFVQIEADAVDRIRANLLAADITSAVRVAHTLKGAAGTIGAATIQEYARQIEESIKKQGQASDESLNHLATKLAWLVGELHLWFAQQTEQTPTVDAVMSNDEFSEKLAHLEKLLSEQDAEVLTVYENLAPALRQRIGQEPSNQLTQAIENFDFEEAGQILAASVRS